VTIMKRKSIIFLLLTASLVSVSACGSSKVSKKGPLMQAEIAAKKPNIDLEYPSDEYLTVTGIGRSEKLARKNALAEMAAYFEAKIVSDVSNKVNSVTTASGNERVTSKAEQEVRGLSSIELKGVELAEAWYDQSQMTYYALAALDRKKAKTNWLSEIDVLDKKIEGELSAVKEAKSPFSRLQPFKNCQKLWLERETILSHLNVLGFKAPVSTAYDIKDIISGISHIRSNIIINVDIRGDENASNVDNKISEFLTAKGFKLKNRKSANILIKGDMKLEDTNLNSNSWKFARATISLKIVDKLSGETIGEISENKRQGHSSYKEAGHKAIQKASDLVLEKLLNYFNKI